MFNLYRKKDEVLRYQSIDLWHPRIVDELFWECRLLKQVLREICDAEKMRGTIGVNNFLFK